MKLVQVGGGFTDAPTVDVDIEIPSDFEPEKYVLVEDAFVLNPDYQPPEMITPPDPKQEMTELQQTNAQLMMNIAELEGDISTMQSAIDDNQQANADVMMSLAEAGVI
ncbi:hypothetical protein HCJ66_15640 [Listeria sp. FSL L7-1582]|uniref:hypothetical protein n=1 Tax=Listeria portnoyi TaxID=2713504 RepID=UPI00164EB5AD|nr:hypothetical protein [Listeria portnoyi]